MSPEDLIATATLSLSGWFPIPSQKSVTGAVKAHTELVKLVNTHSIGFGRDARSEKILRIKLIEEINRISGDVVKDINSDLTQLRQSRCVYSIETEDRSGEKFQLTSNFDSLPAVGHIEAAFSASIVVRKLAPLQQYLLIHAVQAQAELDAIRLYLGFATEDKNALEIKKLSKLAQTQGAVVAEAVRALEQPSIAVFKGVCKTLSWPMREFKTSLPVAVCHTLTDDELRQVASWLTLLGNDIYRPFPIHPDSPSASKKASAKLWVHYEDSGDILFVLAAWLRSLTLENAVHKRCCLCFRHIQERDEYLKTVVGRSYCPKHTNKVGQRLPRRENHIAQIYLLEVNAIFKKLPELNTLSSNAHFNNLDTGAMKKQAEDLKIPSELLKPASVLASQLQKLLPVLFPGLSLEAGQLFEDMLKVACEPFEKPMPEDVKKAEWMQDCRRLAIRWLGWDTFISYWFGKGHSPYWQKPLVKGKEWTSPEWNTLKVLGQDNDPGHRAAANLYLPAFAKSGGAPAKLIKDLVFHRAWIQANAKYDKFCYINTYEINEMNKKGKSFALIGKTVGASPEGIRKTLINEKDPISRNIVQRILPNKLKQLIASYNE